MGSYSETKLMNELIAVCTDLSVDFDECAHRGVSTRTESVIDELSSELAGVMAALRTEVLYSEGTPKMQTTLAGDVKRTVSRIKSGLSNNEDDAVLNHLLSQSRRALGKFTEIARNEALPPTKQSIVQLQREKLVQIKNRIEACVLQ